MIMKATRIRNCIIKITLIAKYLILYTYVLRWSEKVCDLTYNRRETRTSDRWVGARTGAGVTSTLVYFFFGSQPIAPWTSAAAYECAAAQFMDP